MIARVEIEWESRKRLAEYAAATPEGLVEVNRLLGMDVTPERASNEWSYSGSVLIDLDTDGRRLAELGVAFTVKNLKGTVQLTAIAPETREARNVYVQVPHIGLFAVDEVCVREDYCTDALQRDLDEGWRILCVCPPNAQRRPDYIIGRTKTR